MTRADDTAAAILQAERHLADTLHVVLERVDECAKLNDAAGAERWSRSVRDVAEGLAALTPPPKLGLFERTVP